MGACILLLLIYIVVDDSLLDSLNLPSPSPSPSVATISAHLHVDSPYFQNGLVRANVTWRIVDDDKGSWLTV